MKPQRVMNLTSKEERHRAEATWTAYDRAMWTMGFAPVEELAELVANTEQVRDNLKDTVLFFSDQVPFWVKVVSSRQLYGENELRKAGSKGVAPQACMSQVLKCDLDEGLINSESAAQTRAQGVSEQDRYRITFECVQEVHNYFDESKLLRARSASLFWC